jgi:hypothetical protein
MPSSYDVLAAVAVQLRSTECCQRLDRRIATEAQVNGGRDP